MVVHKPMGDVMVGLHLAGKLVWLLFWLSVTFCSAYDGVLTLLLMQDLTGCVKK